MADPEARQSAPSTSSVLWAAWRQGLKDLQTAVLGSWGGTHEEPGGIANPTQQIVTEQMGDYEHAMERAARNVSDREAEIER